VGQPEEKFGNSFGTEGGEKHQTEKGKESERILHLNETADQVSHGQAPPRPPARGEIGRDSIADGKNFDTSNGIRVVPIESRADGQSIHASGWNYLDRGAYYLAGGVDHVL